MLDMKPCILLGIVDESQVALLVEAGLAGRGVQTQPREFTLFYPRLIWTRCRPSGSCKRRVSGCVPAGILGLGESDADRVGLIHFLTHHGGASEMFVVNVLVFLKGTSLGG
jgi:biotin synthase